MKAPRIGEFSLPQPSDDTGQTLAADIFGQYQAGEMNEDELLERTKQLPSEERRSMLKLIRQELGRKEPIHIHKKLPRASTLEGVEKGVAEEIDELSPGKKKRFAEMLDAAPFLPEGTTSRTDVIKPPSAIEQMRKYLHHVFIVPINPRTLVLYRIDGFAPRGRVVSCTQMLYVVNQPDRSRKIKSVRKDPGFLLDLIENNTAEDIGVFSTFDEKIARLVARTYYLKKQTE